MEGSVGSYYTLNINHESSIRMGEGWQVLCPYWIKAMIFTHRSRISPGFVDWNQGLSNVSLG